MAPQAWRDRGSAATTVRPALRRGALRWRRACRTWWTPGLRFRGAAHSNNRTATKSKCQISPANHRGTGVIVFTFQSDFPKFFCAEYFFLLAKPAYLDAQIVNSVVVTTQLPQPLRPPSNSPPAIKIA